MSYDALNNRITKLNLKFKYGALDLSGCYWVQLSEKITVDQINWCNAKCGYAWIWSAQDLRIYMGDESLILLFALTFTNKGTGKPTS